MKKQIIGSWLALCVLVFPSIWIARAFAIPVNLGGVLKSGNAISVRVTQHFNFGDLEVSETVLSNEQIVALGHSDDTYLPVTIVQASTSSTPKSAYIEVHVRKSGGSKVHIVPGVVAWGSEVSPLNLGFSWGKYVFAGYGDNTHSGDRDVQTMANMSGQAQITIRAITRGNYVRSHSLKEVKTIRTLGIGKYILAVGGIFIIPRGTRITRELSFTGSRVPIAITYLNP